MAVSSTNTLQNIHSQIGAMAQKTMNSDFTVEIAGFPNITLLFKQAPWAVLTTGEAVEVALPMGLTGWMSSNVTYNQQGPFSMYETEDGMIDNFLLALLLEGGVFDCTVYNGTKDRFTRAKRYSGCRLNAETVDRDWENRTQPMMISGTMYFHYSGEDIAGNVDTIDG